ncbi:MAG TPA: hypothetical protein VIF62_11490 [Labilithrix sp.]|jgi:hypothetical protein
MDGQLRKQVLAVLELIADGVAQISYQQCAPGVSVSDELFNQWDDVYVPETSDFDSAFAPDERRALERFAKVLDAVGRRTPQHLPPLQVFQGSPEWRTLSEAAREALTSIR